MECPNCQSQDVYKCSVAYEQGTSVSKTTGTSSGTSQGIGVVGQAAYIQSGTHNAAHSSTTTTRSEFARRAAPPKNWFFISLSTSIAAGVVLLAMALLINLVQSLETLWGILALISGVILALSAPVLIVTYFFRAKFDAADERWRQSWICGRCGSIFVPQQDV